ncbi:MAG: hypothetical protein ACKOZX_08980 [Gammaproteobacteria bacterium]
MDVFTMVVLIVAMALAASVAEKYLRLRRTAVQDGAEDLRGQLADLRARVATLEAIVTDPQRQLKEDIARLERAP